MMIYYFSGTGNSLKVAHQLATLLSSSLSSMLEAPASRDETIGLVFPVYAWGLPRVVEDFVRSCAALGTARYLFTVMTCGDDMGYTDRLLDRLLFRSWGKHLDAAFSVPMPNTYICLPGFDVDTEELAQKKLETTAGLLPGIARAVLHRETVTDVCRGSLPWIKTYILRPPFNRFLVTDRYFHVDTALCTHCGLCVKRCPVSNIRKERETQIRWNGKCVGCLACVHGCPHRAINFGHQTQQKGRKPLYTVSR